MIMHAYSSQSFLTVVMAPSFHSLVFFLVLVKGTAVRHLIDDEARRQSSY